MMEQPTGTGGGRSLQRGKLEVYQTHGVKIIKLITMSWRVRSAFEYLEIRPIRTIRIEAKAPTDLGIHQTIARQVRGGKEGKDAQWREPSRKIFFYPITDIR